MLKQVLFFSIILISATVSTLEAQNTYDGVVKRIPEEEVTRQSAFLSAEKQRLLGNQEKAVKAFKDFLYDNPTNDAGWYGLARSYTALKEMDKALESIGKSTALAPDNEWYAIYQSDLYEALGRTKDAIKIYEGLCKKMPGTPEFYEKLAYLYILAEDPKNGLKTLTKLEGLVGLTEEVASKKHLVYVAMGDNKKAVDVLQKLADRYPKDLVHLHRVADFYERIGDAENAQKTYATILQKNPNDPVARLAAVKKTKNSSESDRLEGLKPLFADPSVSIDQKIKELMPFVEKLSKANDPTLSAEILPFGALLEKAHPTDAKAWSMSGDLLYLSNQPNEALDKYKKCISLNAKVFSVWENALTILSDQKKYDEMGKMADTAIDAFPNQPRAYYYSGMAAFLKGKYDESIGTLDQALLMTGNNTALRLEIIDLKGGSFIAQKDYVNAVKNYEQSLPKGGEQHPGILEHLGDALFLSGDIEKALTAWTKANAIRKSPALEQKIEQKKM